MSTPSCETLRAAAAMRRASMTDEQLTRLQDEVVRDAQDPAFRACAVGLINENIRPDVLEELVNVLGETEVGKKAKYTTLAFGAVAGLAVGVAGMLLFRGR